MYRGTILPDFGAMRTTRRFHRMGEMRMSYSNSLLAVLRQINPNRNSPRNQPIKKLLSATVELCADMGNTPYIK